MLKSDVILLLNNLQVEIQSTKMKEKYRTLPKYFTRDRILTFPILIIMRLNILNKSLSVELEKISNFFSQLTTFSTPSKQAFSKATSHIKWEGFKYLNDFFVKDYYSKSGSLKFADKYILTAADGSDIELPNLPELKAHFGEYNNGQMLGQCMAKCVKLYDVLNHVNISSVLSPYNAKDTKGFSEKSLFDIQIAALPELIDLEEKSLIVLGDKYYPCFYYFYSLPAQNINFAFRCAASFCLEVKEFAQSNKLDAELSIDMKISRRKYGKSVNRPMPDGTVCQLAVPDIIKVRCVRIKRNDGKDMFILTSLNSKELSRQEVGEIYDLRWGEETSFGLDKNVLEVENFSAKTVNGILQEFHAKTLTANIAELLVIDAQKKLDEEQNIKDNKNPLIINRRVSYGLVKDEIVLLLNGNEAADLWFARMSKKILRYRSSVRKGRFFPKERKYKTKFSMNMRRST